MKITQLAKKPQLIEIKITDEQIVKEFGEPIEFYTYDRQPLDVFMKLATATQSGGSDVINIVKDLILDENGNKVLIDDNALPISVMIKAVEVITEALGK